jgi:hypothetical protein
LQGWFGGLLASLASEHALDRYAITLLFVASVPLLDRAIGHYALMSHWIVLWGLWLALQPRRELATGAWTVDRVHRRARARVPAVPRARAVGRRRAAPASLRSAAAADVRGLAAARDRRRRRARDHDGARRLLRAARRGDLGGSMYYGKYAANLNALFNPGWGSSSCRRFR